MVLRSDKFDDVYFSIDDGMAETHHVFLEGNNLPDAWTDNGDFTIAETGFGTGLNFLCAWKLFNETATPEQRLHFISVEKYPLSRAQIAEALNPWYSELGNYIDHYLSLYPLRIPGPHIIRVSNNITLTLWFGDINDTMPEWSGQVDAWFLDGFTPAKNPEMWSEAVFKNMARLSHKKTTFATFTAAGFVKRGLESVGFNVEKTKGFGFKRDMMRGIYAGEIDTIKRKKPKTIAIIGGGLAGCAMAYIAKQSGLIPIIYESSDRLAAGASGGRLVMINPKLTAKPHPHSEYYGCAYDLALRLYARFDDIDFQKCSSRHLCIDDDKNRRFTGYIDNLRWHGDHIYRDDNGHLIYPDGAILCPEKLCHALTNDVEIHLNYDVLSLDEIKADIVVIANGYAAQELLSDDISVHSVRGQVSWIKPQTNIDTNICFGGYITPQTSDGFHILGSSFQPWIKTTNITDTDHQDNIDKYNNALNQSLDMNDVIGGWAALRTSSKDRFPIVGHLKDNIYISTAHGSHGIISSVMAAEIILAMATGSSIPASQDVVINLSPKRFHKY